MVGVPVTVHRQRVKVKGSLGEKGMKVLASVALSAMIFLTGCGKPTTQEPIESDPAVMPALEKAQLLELHGLREQAKVALIDVIAGDAEGAAKAQAYYRLGSIAFEESSVSAALESWRLLVQKYPSSAEASTVKGRIDELAEIVGEVKKESIDNAVALSYLRHGEFWSSNKRDRFSIDSSWIPNVEAAIKWYDRVIAEFPGSTASRVAYEQKMRALLGWEDPGQYGEKHGIESSFKQYMPQLLETFAAFEKEHPNATTLQAFRYQIAQAYWSNREWEKTREWLTLIIAKAEKEDSFYRDLAERRLQKIEY